MKMGIHTIGITRFHVLNVINMLEKMIEMKNKLKADEFSDYFKEQNKLFWTEFMLTKKDMRLLERLTKKEKWISKSHCLRNLIRERARRRLG